MYFFGTELLSIVLIAIGQSKDALAVGVTFAFFKSRLSRLT